MQDDPTAQPEERDLPVVLILTACVNVGDCIFLKRRDPTTRQRDYEQAAERYLQETAYPIVWVDNSSADTTFMTELAGRCNATERLEVLSFAGNSEAGRYGKGYGEREALRYALGHSRFRSRVRHWAKVTGRMHVPNLRAMIDSTVGRDPGIEVAVQDDRLHVVRNRSAPSSARPSMLMIFSTRFFDTYFVKQPIDDTRPNCAFEHALGKAVDDVIRCEGPGSVGYFYGARFCGISGTANVSIAKFFGNG